MSLSPRDALESDIHKVDNMIDITVDMIERSLQDGGLGRKLSGKDDVLYLTRADRNLILFAIYDVQDRVRAFKAAFLRAEPEGAPATA